MESFPNSSKLSLLQKLSKLKKTIQEDALFPFDDYHQMISEAIGDYGHNGEAWSKSLERLCCAHQYLINEVVQILNLENCQCTSRNIVGLRSFRKATSLSEHGTTGERIVVLNKPKRYIFVGDVHSDPECIYRLLSETDFVNRYLEDRSMHLVFTGDYVDRGKNHLEVLSAILMLKYLFSDAVTLLQGNHDGGKRHDDGSVILPYRIPIEDDLMSYFPMFTDELAKKNHTFNTEMTELYFRFFSSLPLIASVCINEKCIMAVHGGLPRPRLDYGVDNKSLENIKLYDYIENLGDLTNGRHLDFLNRSSVENMMWSDPERIGEPLKSEGKRFRFSKEHFDSFIDQFDLDIVIRGHEAHEEGVVTYFEDRLYTNFASGVFKSCEENDSTAYDFVRGHIIEWNASEQLHLVRL